MQDHNDLLTEIGDYVHSSKLREHFKKMVKLDIERGHFKSDQSIAYKALIKAAIDSYYENKNTLKNYINKEHSQYFDIMNDNPSDLPWHEYVTDNIVRIDEYSKNRKYARSFVKSYKNLLNDNIIKAFGVIKEKNINRKIIQEKLSKIAAYTSEALEDAVEKIIEENSMSSQYIIDKIKDENLNAQVISNSANSTTVLIKDYEASKALGSSQWCISYNENLYDEYISKVSDKYEDAYERYNESEKYDVVHDEPSNYIDNSGAYIFVWDWTKSESDPMSKIGIAVSAAGDIVAAHDKEDEDILKEFDNRTIYSEECSIIAKENFDILIKKDKTPIICDSIYESPFDVIANVAYPISFYRKMAKKNDIEELIVYDEGVLLPEELLTKTIEDHKIFNFRKDEEVLDDIIWFANFIEEFQKKEPNYEAAEELDDGCGFYSKEELGIYDYFCYFNNKLDVIDNSNFLNLLGNIDSANKFLLIKKMQDTGIVDDMVSYIYGDEREIIEKLENSKVSFNNYQYIKEDKNTYNKFLSDNYKILNLSEYKRLYSSIYVLNNSGEVLEENLNFIAEKLMNKTIHPSNIIKNISKIKDEYIPKIVETLNNLDFENTIIELNAQDLMRLAKSEYFVKNVNENLANALRKYQGHDLSTFGKFDSFEYGKEIRFKDYTFADKMKSLYKSGILDKEAFNNNFNTGDLCFGDKDNYPRAEFSSINEYIFSEKPKYMEKKSRGLKI